MKDNKLIAEFMGLDVLYDNAVTHESAPKGMVTSMRYHESWDWLMPVVEKIERLEKIDGDPVDFRIQGGMVEVCVFHARHPTHIDAKYRYLYQEDGYDENDSKIGVVYKAVVEFIKWYNQNKDE